MSRPDPDRHQQLRRRLRAGGAQGGRVRRGAARGGRDRDPDLRVRARPDVGHGALGRPGGRRVAAARPPRRGARRGERLADGPVLRGDRGRLPLGPRGRRHEGLRRDAADDRQAAPAGGPGPAATDHALLHRRRGGRRAPGRGGADQRAPRGVRGRHGRGGRGRWLQHHRARPADLPHRGRREGHGLDEADRPGPRRPRVDGERRQRGGPAERRGRAARRLRVADPADADHGGAARHCLRTVRDRGDAGERAQPGRRVRRCDPDARGGHQQHRQPDHAVGGLQGQRRPDHGHRTRRRPLAAGLRGRVLRHPERADRRGHRRGVPVEPGRLGRRRTTATWSTRCTAACWPRTRTRSSRRTS